MLSDQTLVVLVREIKAPSTAPGSIAKRSESQQSRSDLHPHATIAIRGLHRRGPKIFGRTHCGRGTAPSNRRRPGAVLIPMSPSRFGYAPDGHPTKPAGVQGFSKRTHCGRGIAPSNRGRQREILIGDGLPTWNAPDLPARRRGARSISKRSRCGHATSASNGGRQASYQPPDQERR